MRAPRCAAGAAALVLAAGVGVGVQVPTAQPAGAATAGAPAAHASAQRDLLAQALTREESLREVKDVQRQFAQLSQFGRWRAMDDLFAADGTLQWGDTTVTGRTAIGAWLDQDAGAMNGVSPGSLDTWMIDDPLVNLSADGRTAQARWSSLRFMGDGQGHTRIEGGIFENDYALQGGRWLISTEHYYPQYAGDYASGWTNVDQQLLPIVPYHFTPTTAGVPIPAASVPAPRTRLSTAQLAARVARLNDEDDVRNLQDSYGYYVDRRMWSDVVDLFGSGARATIDGVGTFRGPQGVRRAMEQTMGPAGLTQGILNDHPIFDTIVDVSPDGRTATTRGTELGLLGDATTHTASWQFSVFHNTFVKQGGLWKLKDLHLTPLLKADYAEGWGDGGTAPQRRHAVPAFPDVSRRVAARRVDAAAGHGGKDGHAGLADLTRRLSRSTAYDGAENINNAYSSYLDDLRCDQMGQIHATMGHKESPFGGFFQGPDRIAKACHVVYGDNPATMRSGISYHWEPQPVILVSHDGRSANIRARLFQPRTSTTNSGFYQAGLDAGMYNDQAVLENGVWKVWDTTIDEEYWGVPNWKAGWAAVEPRDPSAPPPAPSPVVTAYPPDVLLTDMGEREAGFQGGTGTYVAWPDILPMWFNYRNLVTGRVPAHYQPDCTPCGVRPDWSMTNYGYELPPNGPSVDGIDVRPGRTH